MLIVLSPACVVTTKLQRGSLTAPQYNVTSGNLQCTYKVIAEGDNKLALTFTRFDLKKGSIEVYDGSNSTSAKRMATYTGMYGSIKYYMLCCIPFLLTL